MKLKEERERCLRGVPICSGIALGKPFIFQHEDRDLEQRKLSPEMAWTEFRRFRRALDKTRTELQGLKQDLLGDGLLEGAAILDTHLHMLEDPVLVQSVEQRIGEECSNAEWVFQGVIREFEEKFRATGDPFFLERFKDVQDLSRRVLGHLLGSMRVPLSQLPSGAIVICRDLSPTDVAEASSSHLRAFVTEVGGKTSHAAIMAKAKGIPFVTGIPLSDFLENEAETVIVDGRTGRVFLDPTGETQERFESLRQRIQIQVKTLEGEAQLQAETFDGYSAKLSANVEMVGDVELLHKYGGHGVGLFRSEYLFLSHPRIPSEERQYQIYRELVESLQGLPVVIRTFDVGGDKFGGGFGLEKEGNPFLGCRATRMMLKEQGLFKQQLRAILRASNGGRVSILFPFISDVTELRDARAVLEEAKEELRAEGVPFSPSIRVGCMVEIPSAALTCDLLARECDFLSIGTNDLVQYALAVDRGNQDISHLYRPTHPSVIRLIRLVVAEATQQGISVSVCGDMAADPRFTALLLGLRVGELSVPCRYLPFIKRAIRATSMVEAVSLADEVLSLRSYREVQEHLQETYRKMVPEDSVHGLGLD